MCVHIPIYTLYPNTAVYVIHGCWLAPQVGNRYVCLRNRQKVVQESCGGYCDDVTIEERCGNPCCYRDCAMGAWAPWSDCRAACEQPGVKFRNRTVLQVGLLSPFLIGRMFLREASWKYSAKLVGS